MNERDPQIVPPQKAGAGPIASMLLSSALLLSSGSLEADPSIDFETEIAPLLIKRCVECHQGDDPSGGLNLTTRHGLLDGGDSGPVIDPADLSESFLLERISLGEMPPKKQGRPQPLPGEEVETIRRWILSEAPWPEDRQLDFFERTNELRAGRDWWSLQPITRPPIPELPQGQGPVNPIDAFVRAKLNAQGVQPAPIADRRTLLRRLHYDLIGLPPTEAEIQEFERDSSPTAWEERIDHLLSRPQYGERWARYWLDLARYADTSGYERDQEKPFAWKYRDWLVNAFNSDMPYSRFILEQLAGDELPGATERSVIATGFLRLGTWNDEPNDAADYQYDRLEDLVHTTSSAFIGLTVKCARCHSHKFDAITQEDYYRMASAFWAGPIPPGRSKGQLGGPSDEELGYSEILGWTDVDATPPALHRLKNGERHKPMEEVVPASLSSIPALEQAFVPPHSGSKTTQRRLQLAQWIADPRHPLTARVLVNRLWQHHFGEAIVRTPNNFGFLADPPTHPRLLDWLAAEFLANGGRMKAMHRLILSSLTWQQSVIHPDSASLEKRDSTNRWWWRAQRQRLDAETLRDSLLMASGELDLTLGGPGFKPTIQPEALEGLSRKAQAWQASPKADQRRRSLYTYLKRGLLPPLMTTFDLSDPTLSCGQRDVTIVPTQALALLNNDFVHARSQHLAARLAEKELSLDQQIREAWSRILQRQPSKQERVRARRHLVVQTARFADLPATPSSPLPATPEPAEAKLVLHLRADQARLAQAGDPRVAHVTDLSGNAHHALQSDAQAQPHLQPEGWGGQPTLRFNGQGQFLNVSGKLLESSPCTLIAVVSDEGKPSHREILSNWNGEAGNSTTSLFLGLTGARTVRFSDALPNAGEVSTPSKPFILTALSGGGIAEVYQNGRRLSAGSELAGRRLDTQWVIGQQGNINGEFWMGGIAEIRVYDGPLSTNDREQLEKELADRYDLTLEAAEPPTVVPSARTLALASLCHVLMNSNEFLFVD